MATSATYKAVWTLLTAVGLLRAVTDEGAYRLDASIVFEMTLDFAAGQTRTCETRNLPPRANPVLHLLAPKTGSGAVSEVARDDDSAGSLNARFTPVAIRGSDANRIVRQRTLQAIGLRAATQLKLVDEDHDNVWYYGTGMDALFEPEFDSNTRVAIATALVQKDVPQPTSSSCRPRPMEF